MWAVDEVADEHAAKESTFPVRRMPAENGFLNSPRKPRALHAVLGWNCVEESGVARRLR